MPEPCLRHILASEGQDWFNPEKLTQVIDTYVASHERDVSRSGANVASKPVKSFGRISSPQVKSFSPSTTSTIQAQRGLLRCFSCGRFGHKSSQCRTVQFDSPKVVKQPIEKSGGNLTNIPPKAKINHAKTNIQEITTDRPSLVHWLGAKPQCKTSETTHIGGQVATGLLYWTPCRLELWDSDAVFIAQNWDVG